MINKRQYDEAVEKTLKKLEDAGIIVTDEEKTRIEVADFGLSDLGNVGLEILTYVNTSRVCAKELVLFPYQTCPQHRHVDSKSASGKEETFRCRKGTVYLYVDGEGDSKNIAAKIPNTDINVFHEIILNEGEQYTLLPNTWHWFQAGSSGAIVSEFSTTSTDETDIFYDERIKRMPEIES